MSAVMKTPVDGREVVACIECDLVQFRTVSGNCRKCHRPYEDPESKKSDVSISAAPVSRKTVRKMVGGEYVDCVCPGDFDIGFAIWLIRESMNLSQRDLAEIMGCPRTYISKIERYGSMPTFDSLEKFAKAFGIPVIVIIKMSEFLKSNKESVNEER